MELVKHLVLGHGESGKDTVSKIIAKILGLRLAPSTSQIIAEEKAIEKGVPWQHIYNTRRENREQMRKWGVDLCYHDHSFLLKRALARGDVSNGSRSPQELTKTIAEILDCIWWVHADVPEDPTMRVTLEDSMAFAEKYELEFHVVVNHKDGIDKLESQIEHLLFGAYVE